MPAHLASVLAATEAGPWIRAGSTLLLVLVALYVVKRAFDRRARHIAAALGRGEITPEIDTRLRFVQRLLQAAILVIGIFLALSEITQVGAVADKILASGAIVAAVLGFAARQTLGNIIAGVMLAITQPVRVGDWIEYGEFYGMVEDVTLNFTILRTGADQRIVIPNEQIASSAIRNDSLETPCVSLEASVWIAPDADIERAVAALSAQEGTRVIVAEATPTGIRLVVATEPVPPSERAKGEAQLRADALARLHAEGLLPGTAA